MAAKQHMLHIQHKQNVVSRGVIRKVLIPYSRFRINDVVKEHKHQCENIEDIVMAFDTGNVRYDTSELLKYIDERIIKYYEIFIDEIGPADSKRVASFLYRIGFIEGIDTKNSYDRIYYDDSPHFFEALSANHSYVNWEVQHSFRASLNMKNNYK